MGLGIALVAAKVAQLPVLLYEPQPGQANRAKAFMETLLQKDIDKGKVTAKEAKEVKERVRLVSQLSGLAACDFIVEAIPENLLLKRELFSQLDQITPASALLATNTSSISITKLAAATRKPEKASRWLTAYT